MVSVVNYYIYFLQNKYQNKFDINIVCVVCLVELQLIYSEYSNTYFASLYPHPHCQLKTMSDYGLICSVCGSFFSDLQEICFRTQFLLLFGLILLWRFYIGE